VTPGVSSHHRLNLIQNYIEIDVQILINNPMHKIAVALWKNCVIYKNIPCSGIAH
jgi:hypothetical protein